MVKPHVFESERGRTAIVKGRINKEREMVPSRSWQTDEIGFGKFDHPFRLNETTVKLAAGCVFSKI